MKKLGFLRYVITAPSDLVAVLIVLVIRALWGARLSLEGGCVVVDLAPGSWPMRTWYRGWGGTTFGHALMIAPLDPKRRAEVVEHELVHVEQIEGHALMALVYAVPIAVTWHWLAGLVAWALSSIVSYLAAGVVAVLRGERYYDGNANEEAAYAQTMGEGRRHESIVDASPVSMPPKSRPKS